jgi:hypothetical protein
MVTRLASLTLVASLLTSAGCGMGGGSGYSSGGGFFGRLHNNGTNGCCCDPCGGGGYGAMGSPCSTCPSGNCGVVSHLPPSVEGPILTPAPPVGGPLPPVSSAPPMGTAPLPRFAPIPQQAVPTPYVP